MNNIILLIALLQVSALEADQQNFDQAQQQSLATGRPLIVLVGAVWCPACQQMKNSIIPQVAKAGGLNKVVFTYVDFDQQRQLASRLSHGMSIPQLIRFNKTPAGENNNRLIGARSPREVYDFINAGLIEEKEVSKVSTTDQLINNSRKAAPEVSLRSTPAAANTDKSSNESRKTVPDVSLRSTPSAVKAQTPSSVDATPVRQWEDRSSRVEKEGGYTRRMVFFKKRFLERRNRYDGIIYEQYQSNPSRENWEIGRSPGTKESKRS